MCQIKNGKCSMKLITTIIFQRLLKIPRFSIQMIQDKQQRKFRLVGQKVSRSVGWLGRIVDRLGSRLVGQKGSRSLGWLDRFVGRLDRDNKWNIKYAWMWSLTN